MFELKKKMRLLIKAEKRSELQKSASMKNAAEDFNLE